jgi:hypothetical protein
MGSPKVLKDKGDGSTVVVRQDEGWKKASNKETYPIISVKECGELAELYKRNAKHVEEVNHKTIHLVGDISVLQLALKGNGTLEYLEKISREIKAGKYKFSPTRRVQPGKTEKRPLSKREKIVQKALELVLSGIYEPAFLDVSHGFRPNRGTHTALKMIDQKCRGST